MQNPNQAPPVPPGAKPKLKLWPFVLAGTLLATASVVAMNRSAQPQSIPVKYAIDKEFEVPPLETRIYGQNTWLKGGPAALRVIVNDHYTGKPINSKVEISLVSTENGKPAGKPVSLFSGNTNASGTLDAQFQAPRTVAPTCELKIDVRSPLGEDHLSQPIQMQEAVRLMLTSDKPLYQPGQMMHVRALALDTATREALADQPIVFEIEDGRGNKVFKEQRPLSKYGVGSVDFQLADEVNMGTYTLRALLPTIQNGTSETEKKVRVERYVLPKYKIAVTTDKPFYLPGEQVKGTVKATYFFGKPVSDAEVTLTVNTVDIGVTKLTELKDKTDPIGVYNFRYTLPNNFVGQPFLQGKAQVEFKATIKDKAEHQQEANTSVPVVKEPVFLTLVPETKQIVSGVENRIYISAATPDGSPLKKAKIFAYQGQPIPLNQKREIKGISLTADDLGLATLSFLAPRDLNQRMVFTVEATDADGHTGVSTVTLGSSGTDSLLLRSDRQIAKVGERLSLSVFSSQPGGTVYFDLIRNKQTILTRSEVAKGGQATLNIPVTHDMVGTIQIRAYKILPSEDIIRDTRTIIVSPADDLNISVTADKSQYKPGGDAVLQFAVRDQQRRPVQAALGLAFVDESVFALSELQPGLERVYFTLEKELMEPKYEIHGLSPSGLLPVRGPQPQMRDDEKQRAAALLLAAFPPAEDFNLRANSFSAKWEPIRSKTIDLMVKVVPTIQNAIQKYTQETKSQLATKDGLETLVAKGYLNAKQISDPWGHPYRLNAFGATTLSNYFVLDCAGPDGKWDTTDDVKQVGGFSRRGGFAGGFGAGGAFGGGDRFRAMAAAPAAKRMEEDRAAFAFNADAKREVMELDKAKSDFGSTKSSVRSASRSSGGTADEPRVRSFFPETMYWNPSLITDDRGNARLTVPLADSITTWRLSMMANSRSGQLGSATDSLKVFQDFFVDIDLPISLTQHDRIEVPVAIYNYLPTPQQVTLTLKEEPWFALQGKAIQTVTIGANQVSMVSYPIVANAIGRHALEVTARGSKLSDAMRRQIEVTPDGKLQEKTINDRIEGKKEGSRMEKTVAFPANGIEGANSLWVKLYPGSFSQVAEGLDGILRMPSGCFEQTSSSTYPNILVLDYLKKTKKINPELQMKAEGYINVGYQRLVTFECKSGGFSWFGNEPAHQVLTAYGLLEFSDMAKVHSVDPNVIARTQNWLASRQRADRTWEETNSGIQEGIINRQTGALRTTAYIAWALAESGYKGPQVATAISYVKEHLDEAKDPYTLAVILNLLTLTEKEGETTAKVAGRLVEVAKTTEKAAYWQSNTQTFTGARQHGADLETTGLAAYGLAKWGRNSGFTTKVLTYLVQSKDSFGTWESTQGTVWSMKALLYASQNGASGNGTVTLYANGQPAGTIKITPENSDVMRQIDLKEHLKPGVNTVALEYKGDGSLLYQVVGRSYIPWNESGRPVPGQEPMSVSVAYDKTHLAQDDTAKVTVRIQNKTAQIVEMPLVDVGLPPGFQLNSEDLDKAVKAKTISKYTQAARQVIIYLEKLTPNQTLTLTYELKAKYPIKARTQLTKVYPYYNPEKVSISAPQDIVVVKGR